MDELPLILVSVAGETGFALDVRGFEEGMFRARFTGDATLG